MLDCIDGGSAGLDGEKKLWLILSVPLLSLAASFSARSNWRLCSLFRLVASAAETIDGVWSPPSFDGIQVFNRLV